MSDLTPFGPRATITTIGKCEPLPDGTWFFAGWTMFGRDDPRLIEKGCPYMHDAENNHIGFLGWLFTELQEMSDAQIALSMLETTESRL